MCIRDSPNTDDNNNDDADDDKEEQEDEQENNQEDKERNEQTNKRIKELEKEIALLTTVAKYHLPEQAQSILGAVTDDYEQRAKALSELLQTQRTRDKNVGRKTTKPRTTGNDYLRNLL